MANQNIRLRKKNGNAWDVLYPESLASLIKTQTGSNVQSFIDTVYDKIATPTANGVMSKEDKAKLNGIETGANKYVHPNNESTRHVTDVQISSWNDKYTRVEIDNKFNELNIGLDWKESVNTFNDLASTYPNAQDGWTVNVKDTDITYRYTGSAWIAISANSIPLASQSVDGKMSKADKKILDNLKPKVDSLATDLVSISQGISGDITAVVGRINAVENTVNSHTTSISNLNSNKADKNHNHNSSYAAIDHSHSNYASSGHNHNSSYLSINGGTVNGAIAVKMSSPNVFFQNASGTLVGKIRSNDNGSLVISAGADKVIYLRPTGDTSTSGQLAIGESTLMYNGKSISLDGHGNHVPATQSANNAVYLRNDNTWQTITPEKIGAAPASHTHNYFSSTGGDIKGDVFFRDDYTINWTRNSDHAAIGFKNTADNDTDSYMYFRTGDNGNEYFKFQHKTSSGETEWMTIKGDGVRIKGNLVYHQGNKPPASDIIQSSTHRFVSDTEKNTWNAKASTAVATTSANGLMTSAMVTKLNGIATNANNYVHPNDANTRHVTDSEKSNWNSKAAGNHNHTSLTGITSLSFAAQSSDSASIRTAIDGVNTYFDFMLSDDPGENDQWRWIFTPSGATAFNAMVLNPISATKAELRVNGDIYANGNKVYHTGNKPTPADIGAAASNHSHSYLPLSGGTLTGTITAPRFVGDGTQEGSGLLLIAKPSSGKPIVMRSGNGSFHFDKSHDGTPPKDNSTVYLSIESSNRFKLWQHSQSNPLIVDNGNLYFGENVFCVRGIPDSNDRPSIQYIRWAKGADNRDQIHLGVPGNGMILTCDVGFSDRRLKENITDSTENSLEQIKKIKFKAYRFKSSDTPNKERATHEVLTGVIAQEMEEINPKWVDKVKQMENSEYEYLYQINTNNVLYSSLKALQQQQAIIEQLEERISKLENALLQK